MGKKKGGKKANMTEEERLLFEQQKVQMLININFNYSTCIK